MNDHILKVLVTIAILFLNLDVEIIAYGAELACDYGHRRTDLGYIPPEVLPFVFGVGNDVVGKYKGYACQQQNKNR